MRAPSASRPSSTYRLQISGQFTLADAAGLVPYLKELGVGAVYVSPLLRAVDGSAHGYDVVDHREVDPDRGGSDGLQTLHAVCTAAGIGLVVDIVPNHMGVSDPSQNEAWWTLLEFGSEAPTAAWFDVDWERGDGKVMLPVLDGALDPALLSIDENLLRYGDRCFPLAPDSCRPGDRPELVLGRQHYELVDGRERPERLNYRRFFAVSDLAGLRVEDPDVYLASHQEVLRWVREYDLAGLRIDHPDGLADPGGYLAQLAEDAPAAWLTVEKITEADEDLPAEWPVAGSTGYDTLSEVNGLLVDPGAEAECGELYRRLTGDGLSWAEHASASKEWVVSALFGPEVARIAGLAGGGVDTGAAVAALAAAFPVYRSYLPVGRNHLDSALVEARRRHPELSAVFEGLLGRLTDPVDELCVRFQQLTGAVRAKGIEDTAFYRFTRLVALNEVGGDPGRFGLSLDRFHEAQGRRLARVPYGMTTLSTHDTKRGEDVRARMAVLAEMPSAWGSAAELLMTLAPIPNAPFAYLLWQTIVATGLIGRDRIHGFAEKAMREAAVETNWSRPNPLFESSVHEAVDAAYDDPEVRRVVESMALRLQPYGWSNSLSQKLIQLTMPGIPDVYQGSELSERSLVDPDNRRIVDFNALAGALRSSAPLHGEDLPDGDQAKLWLTHRALVARRDRPELFRDYRPIHLSGPRRHHFVAFDRGGAVTLATRLPFGLERSGGWADDEVELPSGRYRNVLTGRTYEGTLVVADALERYPAALLVAEGAP
jgi:(1->4)-alpha-D-glucan 1-alpha-D-glucosylmutase